MADESAVCIDCGVDTCPCTERRGCRHAGRWEHYMVTDEVWDLAGDPMGYLCIGCLEARIGRDLVGADFPPLPINENPHPWDTPRLADRKGSTGGLVVG